MEKTLYRKYQPQVNITFLEMWNTAQGIQVGVWKSSLKDQDLKDCKEEGISSEKMMNSDDIV